MGKATTDSADKKYWVLMLESIIPEEALRAAIQNEKEYIKIFPRPAFASAISIAAEHNREIVIATNIIAGNDARQKEHMMKAINRLCFLAPKGRITVERNLTWGDGAAVLEKLKPFAKDAVVMSSDIAFLDAAKKEGMQTIWIDNRVNAKDTVETDHEMVKIPDWLMFFMSRSIEQQHKKKPKSPAPAPG